MINPYLDELKGIEDRIMASTEIIVLDNGLKVVIERTKDAPPLFKGRLFVPFGSKDEEPEHVGIAHFLEHMCYNGTEKYPTEKDLEKIVKRLGYRPNANTNKFRILFPFEGLKSDLELTTDLVSQLAFAPTFPEEAMDKERAVLLNEIRKHYSNPYAFLNDWSVRNWIKGFPLSHDTLGDPEITPKLDRGVLVRYRNKFMNPNGSYLTLIGDFGNATLRRVCDVISGFKSREVPSTVIPQEEELSERVVNEKKFNGISRAYVVYLFRLPKLGHVDNPSLSIADDVLNRISNSRFYSALREREGLTYGVNSNLSIEEHYGEFVVDFDVDPKEVPKATQVLDAELVRLSEEPVSEDELDEAKKKLAIEIFSDLYNAGRGARIRFNLDRYGFNNFDFVRAMFEVTAGEVQRNARKYLTPNRSMVNIAYPE